MVSAIDVIRLKQEWKQFIERLHPDLFVTITFRKPTSKFIAKKRFKEFFRNLNKPGDILYRKFILSWVFFEERVRDDGCHIHALIKGIDPSLATVLEEKCLVNFGRSKVYPYDHARVKYPASEYLADKYVFFYGFDFLEFYRINSRLRKNPKVYSKRLLTKTKKEGVILMLNRVILKINQLAALISIKILDLYILFCRKIRKNRLFACFLSNSRF